MTSTDARMPLGVVLEKRESQNRWVSHVWRAVEVLPGAPARDPDGDWPSLGLFERGERFHAGTLQLELTRKLTDGYRSNISQREPRVYVVLRQQSEKDGRAPLYPFLVTVCPLEAEFYAVGGEETVEDVPMPEEVVIFVSDYVRRYHEELPFHKRKRGSKKRDEKGSFEIRGAGGAKLNE
ncbi:DUF3305 domain-containing protein [Fodinicurvata sediminis]|uniref:DUF3305 domain-containing protein n=1 Tax=Fodinicurvata sediminis TaxID=1121832 RepID=UPI00138AC03E|nr:DUF3305 domain-containing protein [Fodinicurvata sediminis]